MLWKEFADIMMLMANRFVPQLNCLTTFGNFQMDTREGRELSAFADCIMLGEKSRCVVLWNLSNLTEQ